VLTGANKTQLLYAQDKPPTIRFLMRLEKTERSRPVKQRVRPETLKFTMITKTPQKRVMRWLYILPLHQIFYRVVCPSQHQAHNPFEVQAKILVTY